MVTEAEAIAQLRGVVKIYDRVRAFVEDNAEGFVVLERDLALVLDDKFGKTIANQISEARASLSTFLGTAPSVITTALQAWCDTLSGASLAPQTDAATMIAKLYKRMVESGDRVQSRDFTFGTPAADGGNVGDGVIHRLTVDAEGYDLEGGHVQELVAEVGTDQGLQTSKKHKPIFTVTPEPAALDQCERRGTGSPTTWTSVDGGDSLLTNGSFDTFGGTAGALTSISGWTPGTLSNFTIDDGVNYYRGHGADASTTKRALIFGANDSIVQSIATAGVSFSETTPYYLQCAYNRQVGGTDGTLTLALGAVTASVVLAAQTGWNILKIALGTGNWYKNFKEQDLDIRVVLSGAATFGLRVDEVLLSAFLPFNGGWYLPIGGATPHLLGDKFTWSDMAVESIMQYWIARCFDQLILPHAASAVGVTEP